MAGSSILRQLNDADLEWLHHAIRRDALTDGEIAAEAAARLGQDISESEAGAKMVVQRYRQSSAYRQWHERWYRETARMRAGIETEQRKFELISGMVKDLDDGGFERLSKSVIARLLVRAAMMTDGELEDALNSRGSWIKATLQRAQDQVKIDAAAGGGDAPKSDKTLSDSEQRDRLRKIFGKE